MKAVKYVMKKKSETPSSILETLRSVSATYAEPKKQEGKRWAPSVGDEDEDDDNLYDDYYSDSDYGDNSNSDDDNDNEITKTHQAPRFVEHPQQGVKRPRADSQPEARPTTDLVATAKRCKTLGDSKLEPKRDTRTETTNASGHTQKGKHTEGISNSKTRMAPGNTVLRQGSEASSGQKGRSGVVTAGRSVQGSTREGEARVGGREASNESAGGGDNSGRKLENTQLKRDSGGITSRKVYPLDGTTLCQGSDAPAGQKGCSGTVTVGKSVEESTRGKGMLDGRVAGGDSSSKKTNDTKTQESKSSPSPTSATPTSPIPGPSQPPKDVQALDQIAGNGRSPVEIAAELTLARDAIARHRAQIRLSTLQLTHVETLEKELSAEMNKHYSRGY
ncbi:hypothetical protein BD779DRAFT_1471215 [Infundibulicybe gibba]|nr:hypothetical protein BD779DRAFT_1471215 [Infundibulicybe gibba]